MKIKTTKSSLVFTGKWFEVETYTKSMKEYYEGSMRLSDLLENHTLRAGVNGKPIYDDDCELGVIND